MKKSKKAEGLTPAEAAALLNIDDEELLNEMFEAAHTVKEKIYGKNRYVCSSLCEQLLCKQL